MHLRLLEMCPGTNSCTGLFKSLKEQSEKYRKAMRGWVDLVIHSVDLERLPCGSGKVSLWNQRIIGNTPKYLSLAVVMQ